jgi:hypothetical protein
LFVEVLEKETKRAPEFTLTLADKSVRVNESVLFECRVLGDPTPNVTWMRDATTVIGQEKGIIVETDSDGTQRLMIESVQLNQQGSYCCIAQNIVGKSQTSATLTVKGTYLVKICIFYS